jgi:excisionase family DNA binding protein
MRRWIGLIAIRSHEGDIAVVKGKPEQWPEAMRISTAALYLDMTPQSVYKLIKENSLPVIKFDDRSDRRVRKTDIDALLERKAIPRNND